MKKLVIVGASGHGKVVADIAKRQGYESIVFLDDNEALTECGGYPVEGDFSLTGQYTCDIFIAIGCTEIRKKMQEELEREGHTIPVLVHPDASVGEGVVLGKGTVVMAGAVVNPWSEIGKGCIINSQACIDHEGMLGDYVHLGVGVKLAGNVRIGDRTKLEAGSIVCRNVSICSDCSIEAGAVVTEDVVEIGSYFGNPAKRLIVSNHNYLEG